MGVNGRGVNSIDVRGRGVMGVLSLVGVGKRFLLVRMGVDVDIKLRKNKNMKKYRSKIKCNSCFLFFLGGGGGYIPFNRKYNRRVSGLFSCVTIKKNMNF